jgi:hypothetical protein
MGMGIRCVSGGGFFILSKRFAKWFKVEKWGKGSGFLIMLNDLRLEGCSIFCWMIDF